MSVAQIGVLAAVYPAVWGFAQLGTGALSDRVGRKPMIALGMRMQAGGILVMLAGDGFWLMFAGMAVLGLGTALVYPTLLAAIGGVAHPSWRSSSIGVYRLWRDSGYVIGALIAGVVADLLGLGPAIAAIGGLTAISGIVAVAVMRETLVRR